ncbi:MAG: PIG-L family deacetylase [Pseudomonadota bacterium]
MKPEPNTRYMFLFAHPDDDVFICGTMRALIEAEADLTGVWLTSGGFLGGSEARETELAAAMEVLGLGREGIRLLRLPDLGLVSGLEGYADTLAQVMSETRPDVIFVTAFEGGHPDHDAANFMAFEASARIGIKPRIFEFPLYNGSGPRRHWRWRINRFPDDGVPVFHTPLPGDVLRRKYCIMRKYSSQWMYMIPARLACRRIGEPGTGEPYRLCPPDRDHTVRPHVGTLNYERWFNAFMKIRFSDFQAAVQKVRKS